MSFEEQITCAFETLSDRLRGEIDEQVRRTAAELTAAARADREAAAAAKVAADRAGSSARLIDAVQALDSGGVADRAARYARHLGRAPKRRAPTSGSFATAAFTLAVAGIGRGDRRRRRRPIETGAFH